MRSLRDGITKCVFQKILLHGYIACLLVCNLYKLEAYLHNDYIASFLYLTTNKELAILVQ